MLNSFKLNRSAIVRVAFRCPVSWESMEGDEYVKKCDQCNCSVYNLTNLSEEEIISFVTLHDGNVCAKLQMTCDGKIINGKCLKGSQATLGRVVVGRNVNKDLKESKKSGMEIVLNRINAAKDRLNKLERLYEMQKSRIENPKWQDKDELIQ